jgi:hypothetical protein
VVAVLEVEQGQGAAPCTAPGNAGRLANGGEMFFLTMEVSSTWRAFKYDPTVFRV